MYKLTNPYGQTISQLDSIDIFKLAPIGEYANTVVFSPPINRQEETIRAIQALRLNANESVEESTLNQAL
ncbi:hypothetical protein MCERHM31_00114 [Methylophilaceae bacterium]